MFQRTILPHLLMILLMACSGASGPGGSGPVGAGPVSGGAAGGGPVGGGGAVGGNSPQFAHAAAPGAEEVMLGPGEADPGKLHILMDCEWKCEPDPDGEGSQLSFKGKLGSSNGGRILRIYEYLIQDHLARFQDLQSDTEGAFGFVISGTESRKVKVFLLKAAAEATSLNTVLPCPDDACMLDENGDPLIGVKGQCMDELSAGDAVCNIPLHFSPHIPVKLKVPGA